MKPEKQIRLVVQSVENGYIVEETSYENSMLVGSRWVAESPDGLCALVNTLCKGEPKCVVRVGTSDTAPDQRNQP